MIVFESGDRRSRNLLINGAFEFDQVQEGGTYTTNGLYGGDQWILGDTLSCNFKTGVTTNPYGFVLRSSATAQQNRFIQRIERQRIRHLIVGSKLTFSVYAQVTSGSWSANPIKVRIDSANALDDYSGVTTQSFDDMSAVTGSNIPDGTRRRFYHTMTVTQPMIDFGFQLVFGDFTNATNQVEYSMTMLNEGSHRAPFQRAGIEYSNELALCQRYFEKSYNLGVAAGAATMSGALVAYKSAPSSADRGYTPFKVRKRASPIGTIYSPISGNANQLHQSGVDVAASAQDRGEWGFTASANSTADELLARWHFTADARL